MTAKEIYDISKYDMWYINNLRDIYNEGIQLQGRLIEELTLEELYKVKTMGFSDKQIAYLCNTSEEEVSVKRFFSRKRRRTTEIAGERNREHSGSNR